MRSVAQIAGDPDVQIGCRTLQQAFDDSGQVMATVRRRVERFNQEELPLGAGAKRAEDCPHYHAACFEMTKVEDRGDRERR